MSDSLAQTNVSPPPQPTAVEIMVTEDLTPEEERDRLFLERKVERAFYEAGKALKELRDRRLYRSTHKTFEEYCEARFGFKRRHPYRLIEAAEVVDNLISGTQFEGELDETQMCPNGTQTESGTEMCPNGTQILPTSERQVRPLTPLEPDQQRHAWQMAVGEAGGNAPSGRLVKDIVARIRERRQVPNPYRVGDVCTLLVKENPELRGKGGCWCIVKEVHNFSCTVQAWDGQYQVKIEHLKELSYSPNQRQEMEKISDRLVRLYSPELAGTARAILASLGKLDRPYLIPLEEKLLAVLEAEYLGN